MQNNVFCSRLCIEANRICGKDEVMGVTDSVLLSAQISLTQAISAYLWIYSNTSMYFSIAQERYWGFGGDDSALPATCFVNPDSCYATEFVKNSTTKC